MPPRPPLTTLVIHTWKEHGKPRPLSNHEQSTQAARDRISRSLSYDTHPTKHVRNPSLEDEVLPNPHRIPAVIRSTIEDPLHNSKCAPVLLSSPISTSTEDDVDTSPIQPPLLPRCISTPEEFQPNRHIATSSEKAKPENGLSQELIAPRPLEWPLCNPQTRRDGRATLLVDPSARKARRFRARSVGASREFGSSLLGESFIQASSSFDAGLSCITTRGFVHTPTSRNV